MPTGFTEGILNDRINDFTTFAMLCSRGFGATIHMRDDSLNAQYKPREYSQSYLDGVNTAKQGLIDLANLSDVDLLAKQKAKADADILYYKQQIADCEKNTVKINKMIADVTAWNPPTPDHLKFKEFMLEQLDTTLRYDANVEYYTKELAKIESRSEDPIAIRAVEKAKLEHDITYYQESLDRDISVVDKSNSWMNSLIASLPVKEVIEQAPSNCVDEIERRFILKRRPSIRNWDHVYDIAQYYIQEDNVVKRLRCAMDMTPDKHLDGQFPITYEFLHKEMVSKGHFIEVAEPFDVAEVPNLMKKANKFVTKTRYVHEADGLKFEIDELDGVKLIIMEVELQNIDQEIVFPDSIKDLIVAEITGMKGFSNYDLSRPYNIHI